MSSRILVALRVKASPQRAFDAFTGEIGQWWRPNPMFGFTPREPGVLSFEPGEGGRLIETRTGDKVFEVGKIIVWEPPHRVVFGWRQAAFTPDQNTQVEIRFEAVGEETRITVEHTGWDTVPAQHVARHGFPDAIFLQRHAEWWQSQLASFKLRLQGRRMIDETTNTGGGPKPARAAAFGFIFATSTMNAISFGLMIPVLPSLVKSFVGGDTARAAVWTMVFGVTWGTMQFLWGPVLGLLSDRFGRRPVLLISIFGLGIDFLLMAFSPTIWWLLVGRVINGLTSASFSTANAYVADITPPEDRARRYGLMGSAFGFGFLIGPVIGGSLGLINLRLPFMVAAGMALANGVYGLLILPESLPLDRRSARFTWLRANPVASLEFIVKHGSLMGLAAIYFLFMLSQSVWPNVFVLFAGYRFHWNTAQIGLILMINGGAGIVTQIFLVGPVVKRVGERGILLIGAASMAIAMAISGLAPVGWIYFTAMPFMALSNFLQAGLMALMTRRVGPTEQGRLQGSNQSLQGVTSILGPLLYGSTFAWAVRTAPIYHLPGLPILIAGVLAGVAMLLGLRFAHPAPAPIPTE